jgi:hypothetical protein
MFSMYGALTGNICVNQESDVKVWRDIARQVKLQEIRIIWRPVVKNFASWSRVAFRTVRRCHWLESYLLQRFISNLDMCLLMAQVESSIHDIVPEM